MSSRKDKHFRIRADIAAEFKKIANILGFNETQAAEFALFDWIQRHKNEAQTKLDLFAEKGIKIIQPETVNIAIFQKAEIMIAKDELQRLLDVLDSIKDPEYKRETQLELAKALRMFKPICTQTRDPELLELLAQVEKQLG